MAAGPTKRVVVDFYNWDWVSTKETFFRSRFVTERTPVCSSDVGFLAAKRAHHDGWITALCDEAMGLLSKLIGEHGCGILLEVFFSAAGTTRQLRFFR